MNAKELARELWWPHHQSRTRTTALADLDAGSTGTVTVEFGDFVALAERIVAKWHPRETAPKDGEPFLAAIWWDDSKEWEVLRVMWAEEIGKFVDATYDPFQDAAEGFTLWMPLPIPPLPLQPPPQP